MQYLIGKCRTEKVTAVFLMIVAKLQEEEFFKNCFQKLKTAFTIIIEEKRRRKEAWACIFVFFSKSKCSPYVLSVFTLNMSHFVRKTLRLIN